MALVFNEEQSTSVQKWYIAFSGDDSDSFSGWTNDVTGEGKGFFYGN